MSFLSDAMSTAMPLVREVIVARIRCWWTPWPELDQAEPVEPDVRDVAAGGLVEQRLRRRPEREPLGEPDELLQLGHEVEGDGRVARRDEVVDEPDGRLAGLDPDLLLAVLEDHVVAAVLAGAAGLAVADVGAGEVLELERDVLGDVPDPGALAEPRDEPAAPAEASRRGPRASAACSTSASTKPGILLLGNSSSTPRSTTWRMTGSRAQ